MVMRNAATVPFLKFCQAQLADAQQQVRVLEAGTLKKLAGDDEVDAL